MELVRGSIILSGRLLFLATIFVWISLLFMCSSPEPPQERAIRFQQNPIITKDMLPNADGESINGPSLIRVPEWVENPLGKYYLYFAHHHGEYIRMAYADALEGPWTIYAPGVLHLKECICNNFSSQMSGKIKHIASPDMHINDSSKQILMYFHCPLNTPVTADSKTDYKQFTLLATSSSGIDFEPDSLLLGNSYMRLFHWKGYSYSITWSGDLFRSQDGISAFEAGPNPFQSDQDNPTVRHSAVMLQGNTLLVYYSRIGDRPERILRSTIELNDDWNTWTASEPETILLPEYSYEGIDFPLQVSKLGGATGVRELRDPAIFQEDGKVYLLYSVAGESGIAIAELMKPY